jgi:outer membrane protein assembly factor BamA
LGPRFAGSFDVVLSRALQPWSLGLSTLGAGVTLAWRPVQRLSFTATTEYQRVKVDLFGANSVRDSVINNCVRSMSQPTTPPEQLERIRRDCEMSSGNNSAVQSLQRYAPGVSDLFSIRLSTVWDRRDNPLTPRRGIYVALTTELLYLICYRNESVVPASQSCESGESAPSQLTAHIEGRVNGYVPFSLLNMVLALSARGGRNFSLLDDRATHPSRLFWLGGASSMRGWTQNQLFPQDVYRRLFTSTADEQRNLLRITPGGEFYLNFVADLRVPLGLCLAAGTCLELGIFADVGNVWQSNISDWYKPENWRFSPGVGARLTLPVGILAFDVGFLPYYRKVNEYWINTVQFYLGNTL